MIGLVGAKGSGKTVLMTVLVKQLREVVGTAVRGRHQDRHRQPRRPSRASATTRPAGRCRSSATGHCPSERASGQRGTTARATPVVLRWRQESARLVGGRTLRSTVLSFVDTAGEDLNDIDTAFTLEYLSVCDALIITLDPFALPGRAGPAEPARRRRSRSTTTCPWMWSRGSPSCSVPRATSSNKKRINLPVAIVFTKIDAFYPTLDRQNPIMSTAPALPAYQNVDGQSVHEHMLALLHEWNAADIDMHMRLNYTNYRYFGISALGAEPDYESGSVAPGGVQPHRVEDPVLWLLSKAGTVPSA